MTQGKTKTQVTVHLTDQEVKLPMLPFTSKEERKIIVKHHSAVLKKTESDLVIWLYNHVYGVNVFRKFSALLPNVFETMAEK